MAISIITGGAGFLGSHLADQLILLGHDVLVVDNLSSGKLNNVPRQAEFFELDITQDLSSVFERPIDYVFHLAAQINLRDSLRDPLFDAQNNIIGSLNVMNYAARAGVKRLIFTSTGGAIYSKYAPIPWNENSLVAPESPYGLAKLTIEGYLKLYKQLYNLEYTVLRLSNVFGPRQNSAGGAGVLSIFINNIINKQDLTIFGDGSVTRDFIYCDLVIDAIYHVIKNNMSGIFNVSTGRETSILEIAEKIKYHMKHIYDAKINFADSIKGELPYSCLSSQKLQESLHIPNIDEPEMLDREIELTVKAFLKNS